MSDLYDPELERLLDEVMRDLASTREQRTFDADLDDAAWKLLGDLGLTGVESEGGGRFADTVSVVRAAARHAVVVPVAEHALASWVRAEVGREWRPEATTVAVRRADQPCEVVFGSQASRVVVVDRAADTPALVDVDPDLVTDVSRDVAGRLLGVLTDAPSAGAPLGADAAQVFELRAALLRAAQIDAAMGAAVRVAVSYTAEREQFGRPIAAFQFVQGLAVDAAAEAALISAAVDAAVLATETHGWNAARSRLAVMTAKATASRSSSDVVRRVHQIVGAMGTTLEHSLQTLTRPALAWSQDAGSAVSWERRIGETIRASGDGVWRTLTPAG